MCIGDVEIITLHNVRNHGFVMAPSAVKQTFTLCILKSYNVLNCVELMKNSTDVVTKLEVLEDPQEVPLEGEQTVGVWDLYALKQDIFAEIVWEANVHLLSAWMNLMGSDGCTHDEVMSCSDASSLGPHYNSLRRFSLNPDL